MASPYSFLKPSYNPHRKLELREAQRASTDFAKRLDKLLGRMAFAVERTGVANIKGARFHTLYLADVELPEGIDIARLDGPDRAPWLYQVAFEGAGLQKNPLLRYERPMPAQPAKLRNEQQGDAIVRRRELPGSGTLAGMMADRAEVKAMFDYVEDGIQRKRLVPVDAAGFADVIFPRR